MRSSASTWNPRGGLPDHTGRCPARRSRRPAGRRAAVRSRTSARFRRTAPARRTRPTALGRVNPLALEEFTALEERHTFLATQLEDLRSSKRDLLDIVKEVDERVQRVFTDAYLDTAAAFGRVFARLFPGGGGSAGLTDPQNMLTTGIEVEARPPGKKIKRLSLLSGGERSLTAVALLVAIFQARPSPSTFSTRSRRPSTTPTSAASSPCSPSCATPANSSSSPTRSGRWRSPTRCTA